LIERAREIGFSDERLKSAVNHVIDNCIYPTPTIAEFISFDVKVKTYTYLQVCGMVDKGDEKAFEKHKRILLKGHTEPVWIHVNDISKYGIE